MANVTALESIIATIPYTASGDDAFVNKVSFTPDEGLRSIFGGAISSQAISAAAATVTLDLDVYSSQSTYLHAAKLEENLVHRVERVADGRAYATRVVRSEQRGRCVYIAVIAFQRRSVGSPGPVLTYQVPMPAMDGLQPADVGGDEFLKHMKAGSPSLAKIHAGEPCEWRPAAVEQGDAPTKYRARGFFRSRTPLPRDRTTNIAALAYVSDKWLAATALNANPEAMGDRMGNLAMIASLTHTLSFHYPDVRVDEWLVAERETSWGADGRVMIHQKIWHVGTGRLSLDCTQEAVVRLKPAKL
ncbi:acyl-CoA thioesterase [Diatrype stigma]|uniref:Acyl-CoA thioesterase n=1 Tax=Diatrype stigma TaxID=117547 RepID=A0AAN9UA63_9PEZI